MKIVVCVKQVPSTESRIKVLPDGSGIDRTGLEYVVNPYDEFAVEAALQLKEKHGGEAIAVSVGTERAQEALRTTLALGLDRALLLNDAGAQHVDTLGTAKILAAMIRPLAPDLVLCGKQAVDHDEMAVGIMLAELLDLPHVAVVTKLELAADGTSFTAHREIEGAVEEVACALPAVVTTQKGLNEPRYASLKGIMAAKKKPIEALEPAAIGLDLAALSGAARSWSLAGWASPPARARGKVLTGDPKDTAKELVRLLHEEARII